MYTMAADQLTNIVALKQYCVFVALNIVYQDTTYTIAVSYL